MATDNPALHALADLCEALGKHPSPTIHAAYENAMKVLRDAVKVGGSIQQEAGELPNAIWLAKFFHDTYERLAPQYGYETRQDTRQFDHESPNGRLMAAVCEELRAACKPQGGEG